MFPCDGVGDELLVRYLFGCEKCHQKIDLERVQHLLERIRPRDFREGSSEDARDWSNRRNENQIEFLAASIGLHTS